MWCYNFVVPWNFANNLIWKSKRKSSKKRSRCLAIPNTYKSRFWFFWKRLRRFALCAIVFMIFTQTFRKTLGDFTGSETQTFQKDVEYVPKMSFLSSARLDSLVAIKKAVLRTCWDLSTWNNTCFLFKCKVTFWLRYFSNATFGTLALYILRLRCLAIPNTYKNSFCFFFGNAVFVVLYCVQLFWWFSYKLSEKYWAISPKEKHQLSKTMLSRFQNCLFELCFLKKLFWELPQISPLETIRVFCSNAASRFGRASFRRLPLVLWLFKSCVWDVLGYRILIKTAFVSWAKQELSKTTLSTFKKRLFWALLGLMLWL